MYKDEIASRVYDQKPDPMEVTDGWETLKETLEAKNYKQDQGKPMVELVLGGFAPALMEVAKVGTMGAKKYSPNGWKENDAPVEEKISRSLDAAGRHRLYRQMGEEFDPESGLPHIAHEAWNLLAVLTLTMENK